MESLYFQHTNQDQLYGGKTIFFHIIIKKILHKLMVVVKKKRMSHLRTSYEMINKTTDVPSGHT